MTTAKSKGAASGAGQRETAQEDLQAAYEIHTLVQMVYGQMALHRPSEPPMWEPSTAPNIPPTWPVADSWLA